MRDITMDEIDQVSGADTGTGIAAFGAAGAIGMAAFGSGWGAVGAGLAFAVSPIAVGAMVGLALYGGYQFASS